MFRATNPVIIVVDLPTIEITTDPEEIWVATDSLDPKRNPIDPPSAGETQISFDSAKLAPQMHDIPQNPNLTDFVFDTPKRRGVPNPFHDGSDSS